MFGVQLPSYNKFQSNQITKLRDLKEQIQTDLNSHNPNSHETPGFSHYNYTALHQNMRKPTPNSRDKPNTDPLYSFKASPVGGQQQSINNHNESLIQSSPFSLHHQSMAQATPSGLIQNSQNSKLIQNNNQVSGNDYQINRTLKDGDLGITSYIQKSYQGHGDPSSSNIALLRTPEIIVLFLNEREILKGKKIIYAFMESPFVAASGNMESS